MRWLLSLAVLSLASPLCAQEFIPRKQDKPPGPALSPQEAIAKMTVPPGFTVELVASEPDIVNPIGMAFDERGRAWITESFEYPRREPGVGRDRVKVCEDTDGDGRADKFTVFAEGLNIPSGIAVGHGGVWVANAPDILFLQDTDGDGKADKQEVVVTGFGRFDTHELPNSLTWGPDGYLYGINGVFNQSDVNYPKSSPHYRADFKGWSFTCALFRIHPKTKKFEVFCEGTSNPWGVAFDTEGSAFFSACVIDHLWHMVETGYYHRQGGPYPPFTWKIDSIVKHKHQMAAYCGIHYYDSDAYPAEFRQKLYMGNIHGGCVNVDKLKRDGSSYFATPENDFLTANDVWFMPVVQKTGPDGCLWVLDWYDRYHCYQDANHDPAGVDRLKGRLYRVRYKDTPRANPKMDLAQDSDDQLLAHLKGGNDCLRDLSRRLLLERMTGDSVKAELQAKLRQLAFDTDAPRQSQLIALWITLSANAANDETLAKLLQHPDATFRAWTVRGIGNHGKASDAIRAKLVEATKDASPDVLLQVAIASGKVEGLDALDLLVKVLANCGDDKLIPHIVWQNLHPRLEKNTPRFIELVSKSEVAKSLGFAKLMPRAVDRIAALKPGDPASLAALFAMAAAPETANPAGAKQTLEILAQRIQSRELSGDGLSALRAKFDPALETVLKDAQHPLRFQAAALAASWKQPAALAELRAQVADPQRHEPDRVTAFDVLASVGDEQVATLAKGILAAPDKHSVNFRGAMIASLGKTEADDTATLLVAAFDKLEPELKPRAIEVLTQRKTWGKKLLDAVAEKKIVSNFINVNQAQKLLAFNDAELSAALEKHWGKVRTQRDPQREKFVGEMKNLIRGGKGDPHNGVLVFNKVCGQCHKIHGQGQEVGPDITLNGRSSFDQLLSNVFDPSLVIGASYQARTILLDDDRILTGLLVEDSPQRVVLKVQGGKLETIARGDIQQMKVSELSLMPENLEKQLQPQEIIDLFSFLTLDKPPTDPAAKLIPGTK